MKRLEQHKLDNVVLWFVKWNHGCGVEYETTKFDTFGEAKTFYDLCDKGFKRHIKGDIQVFTILEELDVTLDFSKDKGAPSGYYWVKKNGVWDVAYWTNGEHGFDGYFTVCGSSQTIDYRDCELIRHTQIIDPDGK